MSLSGMTARVVDEDHVPVAVHQEVPDVAVLVHDEDVEHLHHRELVPPLAWPGRRLALQLLVQLAVLMAPWAREKTLNTRSGRVMALLPPLDLLEGQ
jgi:hypothetical protein